MRLILGLASLSLWLALAGPWIPGALCWPLAAWTLGFPWFLGVNLLLVAWALGRGLRRQLGPNLLALGLSISQIPALLNWQSQGLGQFRLLSANCRYFQGGGQNLDWALARFRQLDPDIICAQECSTPSGKELLEARRQLLLGSGLQSLQTMPSLVTFVRASISASLGSTFGESRNSFCAVDAQLGGRWVRIYNVHLQSYGFGNQGRLSKFTQGLQQRSAQAELLGELCRQSPHPVLLCGDFNDVPTSYVYRQMLGQLQDGFRQAGRGLGFSYVGGLPGLRIDYILASQEFAFQGCRYLEGASFLDHRWLLAELSWR